MKEIVCNVFEHSHGSYRIVYSTHNRREVVAVSGDGHGNKKIMLLDSGKWIKIFTIEEDEEFSIGEVSSTVGGMLFGLDGVDERIVFDKTK